MKYYYGEKWGILMTMSYSVQILEQHKFPRRIREIADPPKNMTFAGTIPPEEYKWLAVVGSRKYSNYGKEVCQSLISGLQGYPIIIVSGLALGIDGIAHKSALDAGLFTVGVPGSGLSPSVLYPRSHLGLAEEIIRCDGALLSEFEPNFKATPWSFPQRNRIMAGLSDAVLIIEAEEKSGTLITSKFATEYNRDVFTVPGSIFSTSSAGPHMLLRLGATPIRSSRDILDAFNLVQDSNPTAQKDYTDCTTDERIILELLINPMSRDEIAFETKKPIYHINATLSILEIKGFVSEYMGVISRS